MTPSITLHLIKAEIKNTFSLGIPLVTSQLIFASSSFIGVVFIAKLGKNTLAASVLASTIWLALSLLFLGVLNSVCVLVAHEFGAKNHRAIGEIMGQAYLLSLVIIALMSCILYFMPYLLHFSTQPAYVIMLATQYMRALLWAIPGMIFLIANEQFLLGINRTKIVMHVSILIVPAEILMMYILIFGKFGLPACGIAGIGYSYAITNTIAAIGLFFYFIKTTYYRQFNIFNGLKKFNTLYLKALVSIGLPIGLMYIIEISTFTLATYWIAQFGTTILAAHQIAFQYACFIIPMILAVSHAVTIRVAHSIGKQDSIGIRTASFVGMLITFLCVLVIALAFYFAPTFFLQLDIDVNVASNATFVRDASSLLAISGILLLVDNFRIIGSAALRGMQDTLFTMFASLIGFWLIALNMIYLLGFKFHLQGQGVWYGLIVGTTSSAILIIFRIIYLLKKIYTYDPK